MMQPYMAMMGGMQSQMAQMAAQPPAMPQLPPPTESLFSDTDWTEKQQQISQKMKADYALDSARKKSRADTIMTSPLLDDDEADITSPLIQE
jgi:hypothetical protein